MTTRRTPALAILAMAALLASAGCSNATKTDTVNTPLPVATAAQTTTEAPQKASPTSTSAAPSPTPTPDSGESVAAFMAALDQHSDPDTMREGLRYAAKGSPAHAYLSHQANVAEAALDGGHPYDDEESTPKGDDAYETCTTTPGIEDPCTEFAAFKVDDSGRVLSFSVAGKDIQPRLVTGNGDAVKASGASFTFLSAYSVATHNSLMVTLRVETGNKKIRANSYSAQYRSPEGKQRQATAADGLFEIQPQSNTIIALVFAGVKPGGKVTLDGCVGDGCSSLFTATMKVG